jgi:serine/threonine protein kinase
MTPTLELEESFTSWLAACDEMLVAGLKPDTLDDVGLEPELRSRLGRSVACLERLQELWPVRPGQVGDTLESPLSPEGLTRLGKFEIQKELGRGGFGVVYLAHDTELRRDVALKIPRLDVLLSPELRSRFHHEAVAAARLDHPLIVPVYEAGAVGIVSYIASAYCPGVTLATWLKERKEPVPWCDAAILVADLADAVQHAHSRGVLHRDLKPSNIILESAAGRLEVWKDGRQTPPGTFFQSSNLPIFHPRVTDFGLAKLPREDGREVTLSGTIVGTASYMAPEQAEGKLKDLGTATDVYGLGAILYELLTGRPPFQRETVLATLEQVRTSEPLPPRQLRPDVPADLQTICLKCLQKQPSRRYDTARGLADDIRRLLRGEPIRARPVSWLERGWKWSRRHPVWTVIAFTLLAGLAVTAATLEQQRREGIRQRREQRAALREAISAGDVLLPRVSGFDVRPGVPHNAFTHLEKLYADLEAAPENLHDPDLRHELARAARLLGEMHRRAGDDAAARSSTVRAIRLLEGLAAEFPQQRAYQVDLAVTLCLQADQTVEQAARRSLLEQARGVVRKLAESHPEQPAFLRELARVTWLLACCDRESDPQSFERLAIEAIALQERLVGQTLGGAALVKELAAWYQELIDYYRATGRSEQVDSYALKLRELTGSPR